MRSATNPVIDERCRITRRAACARRGNDHGDVGDAASDVGDSQVAVVLDMHLTAVANPFHTGEVRDECKPSVRPAS